MASSDEKWTVKGGSRNQSGFVNNLDRKGFTISKSLSEVLANSSDAGSTNTTIRRIKIEDKYFIRIDDNGKGMDRDTHCHMYDSERENHSKEQTMGVSGIGGLISLYILSKSDNRTPQFSYTYTKSNDGIYSKSYAPWNEIVACGQYDGRITITQMDKEDIDTFNMFNSTRASGTTHIFPYSDAVMNILEQQFSDKPDTELISYPDYFSIIFGCISMDIYLEKDGLTIKLKKYNYMNGVSPEYYTGKDESVIDIGYDENSILQSVYKENGSEQYRGFKNTKSRCGTKCTDISFKKFTVIGTVTIENAMRKDDGIFNYEDPAYPNATYYMNKYDKQFFTEDKEKVKTFLSKPSLYRNYQRITEWALNGDKASNARGSADSMLKYIYLQTKLSYSTTSTQLNTMDEIMGIQQNKNQHQKNFPTHLTRLINELREIKFDEIKKYMNQVLSKKESDLDAKIKEKVERRIEIEVEEAAQDEEKVAQVEKVAQAVQAVQVEKVAQAVQDGKIAQVEKAVQVVQDKKVAQVEEKPPSNIGFVRKGTVTDEELNDLWGKKYKQLLTENKLKIYNLLQNV